MCALIMSSRYRWPHVILVLMVFGQPALACSLPEGAARAVVSVIDGDISVPEEAGLGIDLDEAVVAKYTVK